MGLYFFLARARRSADDGELADDGLEALCGHGEDVRCISELGYQSWGWDPFYRPEAAIEPADIVNMGYIINVIEDIVERREALIKAWELTQRVLIVSAQVLVDDRRRGLIAYGDGIVTKEQILIIVDRNTILDVWIGQIGTHIL